MKKYIVYEHKFTTSGKSYIGYTTLTLEQRLHKHYLNAMSGLNTKFYKAIRKYGISDLKSEILFSTDEEILAKEKEKEFIKLKDTFKNGYNMTLGGDGGNCVIHMSESERKNYIDKLKKRSTGINNPNHSKLTDEDIILKAVEYFIQHKKIIRTRWRSFSKQNKLPMNYAKCRFNGEGYEGFLKKLKIKLVELKIDFEESQFSISKKERYKTKTFSKISDDFIIENAIEFYLNNKPFIQSKWWKFCKQKNLPLSYSINRFNGKGFNGFVLMLKNKLNELGIDLEYKKLTNQFTGIKNA